MDEDAITRINAHTTAEHVATRALLAPEQPLLTVDVDAKTGAHAKFNVDKLTPRQRIAFVVAAGVGSSTLVHLLDWIGSHFH